MPAHWLWVYFYGAIYCIIFVYLFSLFFKDESSQKRKYTVFGAKEALLGQKDEEGSSMMPMVMDKYGWAMVAIFLVQSILLIIIQI